jgi:hypothetical protein
MFHMPAPKYDHSYPACKETYSTLRIYSDSTDPDTITKTLGLTPTKSFVKGEFDGNGRRRKFHAWFLSTQNLSDSRDTRYHMDVLITALEGKTDAIQELQARGCDLDISSYWVSEGQGGPEITPAQMLKLGAMGLRVWWDIYFSDKNET